MEYLLHLGILISIYSILGMSLNLVVGYTGLLSVTHAAFFGIGAYATAILSTVYDLNFFVTVLVGMLVAGVVATLIGLVLSRFDDDIYALASFGFNIIIYAIFLNWQSLTRGPLGIPGIDRPSLLGISFSENALFLLLSVLFALGVYLACSWITSSSFGRTVQAIRDDEQALSVFGYNTVHFKFAVFTIGAAFAAVAGSLFASYITFIDPSSFVFMESVFILTIIIVGGLANHKGAVLGAVILVLLPELLRFVGLPPEIAAQMRQLLYGLLLIAFMLYKPQGFLGKYRL
jgi:branched-chain amino acid transport system permease protein